MPDNRLTRRDIKDIYHLRRHASRLEQNRFLIEGRKLVEEAIQAGWEVEQILATEEFLTANPGWNKKGHLLHRVSLEVMEEISDMKTSPEIAATVFMPEIPAMPTRETAIYLDGISDPGNLGTIIRTTDWFGISHLFIGPDSADPFSPKVVRSAMGSLFHVNIIPLENPTFHLKELKNKGYQLVMTSPHEGRGTVSSTQPICLVMGSESHGISEEVFALSGLRYKIPGFGQAESLNVAISAGISLYDLKVVQHLIP